MTPEHEHLHVTCAKSQSGCSKATRLMEGVWRYCVSNIIAKVKGQRKVALLGLMGLPCSALLESVPRCTLPLSLVPLRSVFGIDGKTLFFFRRKALAEEPRLENRIRGTT
jgi:hypothetical protein